MDTVNVETFIEAIERDITELKVLNEHIREKQIKKMEAERLKNIRQHQEKLKKQLMDKIKSCNHIPKEFGMAFNDMIEGDWGLRSKQFKELVAPIELGTGSVYTFSFINHYRQLEEEDKHELVDVYREKISQASTENLSEYMDYVQVDFHRPLSEQEKENVLTHFKTLLITFIKGYMLQDNVYYYAYEAIPSILAIIELSEPTSLFEFPLFEFNSHPQMKETEWSYWNTMHIWYQQKGKNITHFEELLEDEVIKGDYKGANLYFKSYGYLFEEAFRMKQEQALLSMLYQKYMEAQKEPHLSKRETDLVMIRNELFQFSS